MTITLEVPQAEEAAWNAEAKRLGMTLEDLAQQAVQEKIEKIENMETLIANVRNQRVPQSVDELRPRRLPPPGKTAMQMVYQQLQTDETDEEIFRALEELS